MKTVDLLETVIRGFILEEIKPSKILEAFNNVCVEGVLEDAGYVVSDAVLQELLDGLDMSLKALREMEKESV